jgi:hypothetical protein
VLTINLAGLANLAGQYHVHMNPTQPLTADPCGDAATGGHFNPLNVPANTPCTPTSPNLCEVGDLSGKNGDLANQATVSWTKYDSYLPLSGTNSIIGRSVVIHKAADASRWVCADIVGGPVATSSPAVAPICTPNKATACPCNAAGFVGSQVCNALGSAFGQCICTCTPNSNLDCSCPGGTTKGTQVCNAAGTAAVGSCSPCGAPTQAPTPRPMTSAATAVPTTVEAALSQSAADQGGGLSGGAIAGIVIAVLLLVAIAVVGALVALKKIPIPGRGGTK